MRRIALAALATSLALVLGEAFVRLLGFEAWDPTVPGIAVEPGGRIYESHPTLGYAPIPGRYSVLFETGLRFHTEHDSEGHRRTRALDSARDVREVLPEAWIFGGSFTYGWAIDDERSFPWRLQERMPDLRVRNFAVPGYGTLQALLELEDRLEREPPPLFAIVVYASFHDVRNTFARERRKRVAPHNRLGPLAQPHARLTESGGIEIARDEVAYRPWPLMRNSALVHLAETRWNQLERRGLREADVTRAILERFAVVAREAGIRPVLATLTRDRKTAELLEFAKECGIETADLWVDLDRPGYRNLPHDAHPSPRAADEYAARLEAALRSASPQQVRAP